MPLPPASLSKEILLLQPLTVGTTDRSGSQAYVYEPILIIPVPSDKGGTSSSHVSQNKNGLGLNHLLRGLTTNLQILSHR